MKIEIDDLKKVKLEKGDVLVLRYDNELSGDDMQASREVLKEVFPNNKVIFCPKEMELSVITQEMIND